MNKKAYVLTDGIDHIWEIHWMTTEELEISEKHAEEATDGNWTYVPAPEYLLHHQIV